MPEVTLILNADVDGDGFTETGRFEGESGAESFGFSLESGMEMEQLIGQQGSGAADTIINTVGPGEGRLDVTIDLGLGRRLKRIQFTHNESDTLQWGDGSGSFPADATGEGKFRKDNTLDQYLARGRFDSIGGAKLEYGEYASSGALSPLQVMPLDVSTTISSDRPAGIEVNITCIVVGDLTDSDAVNNRTAE